MDRNTRTTLQDAARDAARALANINAAIVCLNQATEKLSPITERMGVFEDSGRCLADFKLGILRARLKLSHCIGDIPEQAWDIASETHVGFEEVRALVSVPAILQTAVPA